MISDDVRQLRLMLRRRAMDLLARREHTRHELGNKLLAAVKKSRQLTAQKSSQNHHSDEFAVDAVTTDLNEQQLIAEVLDKLEQDKLLSDARFTESYVNGRLNRGYGPQYIRHQLRQKQVDGELLDNNLQLFDQQQWVEQLLSLIRRRLGETGLPERGSKEYLKLQRFVLARGFTASQWYEAEKRVRSP